MSNSEYREAQQQARDHGLKARQEARLENATYTAAEVKVLTEDACKVAAEAGRRIGRAEAAEEIAAAIGNNHGWQTPQQQEALDFAAQIARNLAYHAAPGASEPRTDTGMGMDLPPEPQAVREPQEEA